MPQVARSHQLGLTRPVSQLAWIGALSMALDAVIAWRLGERAELPAYFYFGVLGAALAVSDIATRRLPNVVVLPSYPIAIALLALAAHVEDTWGSFVQAGIGMVVLSGIFLGIAVAFPGQLGFGDVKLAGLLGLYLTWLGLPVLLTGMLLAWTIAAVGVVVVRRLLHRHGPLPLAPFLVAGAFIAIVTT
jgi:leader peptidase (prepilin peptidase)/N-methyltransferase